jgi:hypothetical protein
MSCSITIEILADLLDSKLSPAAQAEMERHLAASCLHCQDRLAWLREALPALADALPNPALSPSSETMAYVRGLHRLLTPERQRPDIIRHVAQRIASAARGLAPAGARGASASPLQLFETDQHILTLWSGQDAAASHYVIGQVYERNGGAISPLTVELMAPNGTSRTAEPEGAEFHLEHVEPGSYLLLCALGNEEIVLPHFEVGLE